MIKLYKEFFDNEVGIETIMRSNEYDIPLKDIVELRDLCDKRTFLIKYITEKEND